MTPASRGSSRRLVVPDRLRALPGVLVAEASAGMLVRVEFDHTHARG